MILYIASANRHKIQELQSILAPADVDVLTHPDFDLLAVEETGITFEENASIKAVALSKVDDNYVIADDSGIEVDALNGAPGVYSARYSKEGTDESNNALLLANMEGIAERTARFVSVIALAKNGHTVKLFRGECEGKIGFEGKGENGFGYDPLFIVKENGKTMAELTPEEKNAISHRKRAAEKLYKYLTSLDTRS